MSAARTFLRAVPQHVARRAAWATPRATIPRVAMQASRAPAAAAVRFGSTLPPRNPSFTQVTEDHVKHLRSLLGSTGSLMSTLDGSASADELVAYNDDWMNKYHGKSQVVVKPKSTEEVAAVMKYCNEQNIAVVPQGGNTGLVGGGVPIHDEVVLSLANMNQIRSFDPVSGIFVGDAGVILEAADNFLAEKGFIFPLDLGAKGSCQIGGNVATNAGGLRLLRYGSLHGTVLGLEVVLPDGTIWNGLRTLRKDNTGFDLKQLFIGSEGSLGVITGVSIMCPRRPKAMNVAVFSVESYEAVQAVFADAKDYLGEILSAFEFWDQQAYAVVRKHHEEHLGGERKVFENEGPFYCLIETGGSNAEHDEEKLGNFLEHVMAEGKVIDGVLAQDSAQFTGIWSLREGIPEACGKFGSVYKYDLSIPVGKMYDVVEKVRARVREAGLLKGDGSMSDPIRAFVGYGHMGDGNLHINIVAEEYREEIEAAIEPYVYEVVSEYKGSISAEHGLGVMKAPHIHYSQDETSVKIMRDIKQLFDPKGICNPYKYLP
ncbi:uncharacterized protein COLE_06884 [Cutaneotrichosporon oleaginosum]|nr:hypothetical protein COLE_06884 [Cutaneotrichosporon oleaginosum]